MRTRFFRLKMLVLFASGALLPAFIISCEKAAKTAQIAFFDALGENAIASILGGGG